MELKFTPEAEQAFILETLENWAEELDRELRTQLRAKVGHVPEETIKLLSYRIAEQTTDLGSSFILSFQDSGRHVDMRNLNYKGRAISRGNNYILEWVKKRGVSSFRKGVPGYSRKAGKALSEDQKAQRIASAIIVAKGSQKGRKRRRRKKAWSYNKTIYGYVSRLLDRLIQDQKEFLQRTIGEDIANNVSAEIML